MWLPLYACKDLAVDTPRYLGDHRTRARPAELVGKSEADDEGPPRDVNMNSSKTTVSGSAGGAHTETRGIYKQGADVI